MYPFGVTPPNGATSGIEFAAFNCYALHQDYLDDIVRRVVAGESVDAELSSSDIEYIEKEVGKWTNG